MAAVPPRHRLLATVLVVIASFIADKWLPLAAAAMVIAMLMVWAGLIVKYLQFVGFVLAPMAVMLIVVWGFIAKAAPGEAMGSSPSAGIAYAIVITLRLAVVGGVMQLAFLSIPPRLIPATARGFGLRGEGLVVAMGVFAVGPELVLRGEQIITARRARGLLGSSKWQRAKVIPHLLRPLFVWSIRAAVQRADAWEQRAMLLRVENLPSLKHEFSRPAGIGVIGLGLVWIAVAVCTHWPILLAHLGLA